MRINSKIFEKRKKLLLKINTGVINKEILKYINEARSAPQDFSRHLMYNDEVDEKIGRLSIFFKYNSKEVLPLILEQNLVKCADFLLRRIVSLDNGLPLIDLTKEEKENNSLKVRLKNLSLIPTFYKELIVIGTDNPIDAVSNLFLNDKYKETLLSQKMTYIGIASGLLPSERICIIIDIVKSLIIDNSFYKEINLYENLPKKYPKNHNYINFNSDYKDDLIFNINNEKDKGNYSDNYIDSSNYIIKAPNTKYYIPKKETFYNINYGNKNNNKKFPLNNTSFFCTESKKRIPSKSIDPVFPNKNKYEKKHIPQLYCIKMKGVHGRSITPSYFKGRKELRIKRKIKVVVPVSISIERTTKKCNGQVIPFYSREILYDDGSLLMQPL